MGFTVPTVCLETLIASLGGRAARRGAAAVAGVAAAGAPGAGRGC